MHARRAAAAVLVALAAVTACGKSEAEEQADCEKALTSAATKTNRPDACKGLSQKDYDTLLMGWALENAIDGMSQEDRDLLDYSDDGELNGSIGG
jgi:hypothetical protein